MSLGCFRCSGTAGGKPFGGSNHQKDQKGCGEEQAPVGDLGVGLNAIWIGQKEGCLKGEQREQRWVWGLLGVDETGRDRLKRPQKTKQKSLNLQGGGSYSVFQ